jgi:hypothetical protein
VGDKIIWDDDRGKPVHPFEITLRGHGQVWWHSAENVQRWHEACIGFPCTNVWHQQMTEEPICSEYGNEVNDARCGILR